MLVPGGTAVKGVIDGVEPVGMLAGRPPALRCDKLDVNGAGQTGGDLVLDLKEVAALLVEAFGPQMCAALGIDELRVDPDSIAHVLHAAFEHVPHAKFATDLAGVARLALLGESGAARDYEDAGTARTGRRQRLGEAVHEGGVLWDARGAGKWQDDARETRR